MLLVAGVYDRVVATTFAPGPLYLTHGRDSIAPCAVTFEYASTMDGTIVRFRGADQAGLLDAYIEDVGAVTLIKGYQLLTQPIDLSGRPAIELNRDGFDRTAWQVSDLIIEMATAWAEPVSSHLPGIRGPLPQVTPPAAVPTQNPKAQVACSKVSDLIPSDFGSEHFAAQSGVGPEAMAGTGYNGEDASPSVMTDGLLDTLGIGPFDVCRTEFQHGDGDVSTGRIWKLGKGGAATLQSYLDDLAATLQAGGATVVKSTEKVGQRTVSTLTVTGPGGTSTWYYAPTGKAFVEFRTEQEARRMLPLMLRASTGWAMQASPKAAEPSFHARLGVCRGRATGAPSASRRSWAPISAPLASAMTAA